MNGIFIISLDFELYWGLVGLKTIERYKQELLGTWKAIPLILELFKKYKIHATWGIVGFLFFKNKGELFNNLPKIKPNYKKQKISPYNFLKSSIFLNYIDDFFFAPSLINMISNTKYQEIASHTFSHYYCLEKGQDIRSFEEDIKSFKKIAIRKNFDIQTIIFPRNQINYEYLYLIRDVGIKAFRDTYPHWIYRQNKTKFSKIFKFLRFLDSYICISGRNTYQINKINNFFIYNIPVSQYLFPYSNKLRIFENVRLNRILKNLFYAATNKEIYHLWWHPHSFGTNLKANLNFLEKILKYFAYLRKEFNMKSYNMKELINFINKK
ncbi:MAG: polysaccharide deacetylase family protein [Promethearchaeota archaeon]